MALVTHSYIWNSYAAKKFFACLTNIEKAGNYLIKHIQSRDILHKSQIGFLANNRTADHVLTRRTLIDKYVNCHKTKVYACFVDFRNAFDSVWHDGLLYKLLQINVRGNFYKVIKRLYSNSTCPIRIGNNVPNTTFSIH